MFRPDTREPAFQWVARARSLLGSVLSLFALLVWGQTETMSRQAELTLSKFLCRLKWLAQLACSDLDRQLVARCCYFCCPSSCYPRCILPRWNSHRDPDYWWRHPHHHLDSHRRRLTESLTSCSGRHSIGKHRWWKFHATRRTPAATSKDGSYLCRADWTDPSSYQYSSTSSHLTGHSMSTATMSWWSP